VNRNAIYDLPLTRWAGEILCQKVSTVTKTGCYLAINYGEGSGELMRASAPRPFFVKWEFSNEKNIGGAKMSKYFKKEELARCFRANGARCKKCPLKQPADKLPDGVEGNLDALAEQVLEPARQRLGKPITVNSGYRCQLHNKAVGGATSSQHMRGEATDLRFDGKPEILAKAIVDGGKWDQLILYPTFVHVSYKRNGMNRLQCLKKTATGYANMSINELK